MRILLVTPFQYEATGGVSTAVRMLSREFREQGHEVCVLARGRRYCAELLRYEEGARLYGIRLRTPTPQTGGDLSAAGLKRWTGFLVWLPVSVWSLWRLVKRERVNLLLVQYAAPKLFPLGLVRMIVGVPLVVTFQGGDAHTLAQSAWVRRRLLGFLLGQAACVTAVSRSLMLKAREFYDLKRTEIIPNGASRADGASGEEVIAALPAEYVASVGKLIPRKGVDVLLKATAILRARNRTVHVVIVGDGPERAPLESLANSLEIADQVTFLGDQPHAMALAVAAKARVFVLASHAEGLPLAVVEAMNCGTAVVATAVDGTPDIVRHEETGLLIRAGDDGELADAVERLFDDDLLRERLAQAGARLAVTEFSWERIAGQYLACVDSEPGTAGRP
jgi:glycogen synthase